MPPPLNPFAHHHGHHDQAHDHDHDHGLPPAELDPAQQALADALRVSFGVLKLVMLALAVVYLLSGIVWGVPAETVAVRLRFGAVVGTSGVGGEMRSGRIYLAWPYPIEQVVFVPTSQQEMSLTRAFWFELPSGSEGKTGAELEAQSRPLNPERDGSLLTGDQNIVHAQWSIKYKIRDPQEFLRNVAAPSSARASLLQSAEQIVRVAAEEGIVYAAARVTADEVVAGTLSDTDRPSSGRAIAQARAQDRLDALGSGIAIDLLTARESGLPLAVRPAFRAVTNAASDNARAIEEARKQATTQLTEVAGPAHAALLRLIDLYEQASAAGDAAARARLELRLQWVFDRLQIPGWAGQGGPGEEQRWEALTAGGPAPAATQAGAGELLDIGGAVAQAISQARADRSQIVAQVATEARVFNPRALDPGALEEGLLQQYQRNPQVFLTRQWQDMLETILRGDVEVFYLPPGQVYLELNRDPKVRQDRERKRLESDKAPNPAP